MVKACHLTSVHEVNDDRIYIRECSTLAKSQKYDVYICGPDTDQEVKGVTVVGNGAKESSFFSRIARYDRKVVKTALKLNADIYHIHDPELLLYVKKLKKSGAKVIFDSHEDYSEQIKTKTYIPYCIRSLIAAVYKSYENHVCKIIDGVVFPCLVDGKDIFANKTRHHALINNVPVFEEIPKGDNHRDNLGGYVCHAGGLTPERGIEQLIDGCFIAGIRLVLAGSFSGKDFEERLRSKESFSIVDYKGQCSRKEIMEIYKNAAMGASTILPVGQYPRIWNLPTKVYEFMMYELPFIISDFEYCRGIVERYKFGITVDSTDPTDIARGIRQIMDNPKESLKMGRAGKKAILEDFNWNIEGEKLLNFYNLVLEN